MDFNKIMNDFENIKSKVDGFEKQKSSCLNLIKTLNKEIKKLESKKESDPIDKAITKLRIAINKDFLNSLNNIFSLDVKDTKEAVSNGK